VGTRAQRGYVPASDVQLHSKVMGAQCLVAENAAFGLHIVLSTQSYQNLDLEPDVKAQFHLRIALRLSTSMECRALMGRDNDAPLGLPRFAAVYNRHQGDASKNRILALDDLPREELMTRLEKLRRQYPGPAVPPMPEAQPDGPEAAIKSGGDEWADWDSLN
jgi:hypothetical protein